MALHFALFDVRLHQRSSFVSGTTALDSYLQQRASQHQRNGPVAAANLGCARAGGRCQRHPSSPFLPALRFHPDIGKCAYPVPAAGAGVNVYYGL